MHFHLKEGTAEPVVAVSYLIERKHPRKVLEIPSEGEASLVSPVLYVSGTGRGREQHSPCSWAARCALNPLGQLEES